MHGTQGETFPLLQPPGAKAESKWKVEDMRFEGILSRIERTYRRYRQQQEAHSHMESYLEKVMVERPCPDCKGARVRPQRLLVTLGGKNVYTFGEVNFADILAFSITFRETSVTKTSARRSVVRSGIASNCCWVSGWTI
jgi:excinuclease ABC subunit A